MNSVKAKGFDQRRAMIDIERCLENANTPRMMDVNYYVDNPHIFINSSDRVKFCVEKTVNKGDSVLTVASSGDYLLESVYNGAKRIVSYDINANQYYATCLKVWAVQVLSYEEYLKLFTSYHTNDICYLNPDVIRRVISHFKEEPAYMFWLRFAEAREEEIKLFKNFMTEPIFQMMYGDKQMGMVEFAFNYYTGPDEFPNVCQAVRMIEAPEAEIGAYGYLTDEKAYNKLKERIGGADLSFINSDVCQIKDSLDQDEKFDAIFLSNIPFYLSGDTFVSVVNQLLSLLNESGTISYYHQNMKKAWFKNKEKDRKFEVSDSVVDACGGFRIYYQNRIANLLNGHLKLMKMPVSLVMTDIPTYNGMNKILSPYDVKVLIKAKK